jgi:hypothetical protein
MTSSNDFDIIMDFPNWTQYEEIVNICQHVSQNNISDILCAGTYGGRVASAICRSFSHIHVTALDTFDYLGTYRELRDRSKMTCGDKFLNQRQSLEQFKSMHPYQNITAIQADFFNYTTNHQMVIIELYPHTNTWETIFDHALSLSDHVIGTYSQFDIKDGVWGKDTLRDLYNYELINDSTLNAHYFDIYRVLSKKL